MKGLFRGTGVALVTPFDDRLQIDWSALDRLIDVCLEGGVDFLVVMGTTAESATLSSEERKSVARHVVSAVAGRVPLLYGWGGNNTAELIAGFESFDFSGYSGLLSVAPYYNKPTQKGLRLHFEALADATPLPIVLYNVPGRTASNLSAETTLALAQHPSIVGIKEASGDLTQITRILMGRPEGFGVLSGDDNLTFSMMGLGAEGVISVVAQLEPRTFSDMVRALEAGAWAQAKDLHFALFETTELLFAEGNPAGVKAGLALKGLMTPRVRLPLAEASDELKARLGARLGQRSPSV
ncbi:4-hydroxy-tetrahydrodipicolinate synthase [bacterium]|nr:4-hydroxy-tetrahydrodipicolinate synthase [bacterium]